MKTLSSLVLGVALASPALAQSTTRAPEVRQLHYQLDMMERVLEAAVAHGAVKRRVSYSSSTAPARGASSSIPTGCFSMSKSRR